MRIRDVFFNTPPSDGIVKPDLDLHVWCSDGRHVGVDYATGAYDVEIADTITTGDNQGAPEWIFFPPEGNEDCKHVVSSHDNEAFLAAHPEIAAELTDATDSYEIYARYIDPATGIFTSATLADETIEPGTYVEHAVSGTSDVTIGAGVVDVTAPTVTIDAAPDASTTSTDAVFAFHASEGGASFECALDGSAFLSCTSPVSYGSLAGGNHLFEVRASDPSGNEGAAASYAWTVDTIAPVVTFISTPSDPSGEETPVFEWTVDDGSPTVCSLDGATSVACTSPFMTAALLEGSHAFEVSVDMIVPAMYEMQPTTHCPACGCPV